MNRSSPLRADRRRLEKLVPHFWAGRIRALRNEFQVDGLVTMWALRAYRIFIHDFDVHVL
jgi:hypothetical protein